MLPKDVLAWARGHEPFAERCRGALLQDDEQPNVVPASVPEPDDEAFVELLVEGGARSRAARRYLFFLSTMDRIFTSVLEHFDVENPTAVHADDRLAVMTTVEEMLFIANHLYVLDSYGVPGAVLECGAFKGFSSCCLSWACAHLGRRLVVADSFQGLPPDDTQACYVAEEFKGTIEEVRANLESFGRPGSVELLQGFYADSLVGFPHPLALLWIDVDLSSSVVDVLSNAGPQLDRRGVIYCNEFGPAHVSADHRIVVDGLVPRAVDDFLARHGVAHVAEHVVGWTALIVPGAPPGSRPALSARRFLRLLEALRGERGAVGAARRAARVAAAARTIGGRPPRGAPRGQLDTIQGAAAVDGAFRVPLGETLVVHGWAVDGRDGVAPKPCGGAYVEFNGTLLPGRAGRPRPDVARALGRDDLAACGFEAVVPRELVRPGANALRLVVLSSDGSAYDASPAAVSVLAGD